MQMAKEASLSRESPDEFTKAGSMWGPDGRAYDVYTKDAEALKKTIYSTVSIPPA